MDSCVWLDTFIYRCDVACWYMCDVTWHVDICVMWRGMLICVWCDVACWSMCDVTRCYACRDTFIFVMWLRWDKLKLLAGGSRELSHDDLSPVLEQFKVQIRVLSHIWMSHVNTKRCSTLICTLNCCRTTIWVPSSSNLRYTSVCCSVLQHVAACCSMLQ